MISFLLFCAPPFLCLCWLRLDSISWWAEESLSDCTSLYTSWGFHHLCLLPEQLDHQKLGALHCYIDTCRVTPLNGCLCFCGCSFSASRITLRCHLFCHQWSCYRDYLFLFVWINNHVSAFSCKDKRHSFPQPVTAFLVNWETYDRGKGKPSCHAMVP